MKKAFDVFETTIVGILMILMGIVVLLATISLAWTILKDFVLPPSLVFVPDAYLESFGAFLLVLVGLELLETIRAYFAEEHVVHAEVVFLAAMIAVTRKVITLDFTKAAPLALFGMAAIILALAMGYCVLKLVLRLAQRDCGDKSTGRRGVP